MSSKSKKAPARRLTPRKKKRLIEAFQRTATAPPVISYDHAARPGILNTLSLPDICRGLIHVDEILDRCRGNGKDFAGKVLTILKEIYIVRQDFEQAAFYRNLARVAAKNL